MRIIAVARLIPLCLFLCTGLAWSADVQVTSTLDAGAGTLRDALVNANPGDRIVFSLPPNSTILLDSTLTVSNNLAIEGDGSSGLTISGTHAFAVFKIDLTYTATISNLTIADGSTGILNQGTLTVLKCTIRGSSNIGIANSGALTVANSTFSGNASLGLGGAIKITSGSATITNNTFVDNSAQYGGAIENSSSSNSTARNNLFHGNSATQFGASIYDGQGKLNADHNLYWQNPDNSGEGCYQCVSDTNAVSGDPLLGLLADHGGPTQTYLPGVGSAAIDSGDDVLCATPPISDRDQRGLVRPLAAHCDIGAVESNDQGFSDGFELPPVYATSFETCPDGWTLTGDWQCGVPQSVGPPVAFNGTSVLATIIAGNYNNVQSWAGTTATSPEIDLTGRTDPTATFYMWVDTEGSTYDGANLMISTDGGANYEIVSSVTPAYPLLVAGKPAWGGRQSLLGWQPVVADLTAYAGNVVRLQFAFRSDTSGTFPGVYIDSLSVQ